MQCCDKSARKPLLSSDVRQQKKRKRLRCKTWHNNNNSRTPDLELNSYPGQTSDCEDEDDEKGQTMGQGLRLIGQKTWLLLWKNLLFRRRHYIVTALEIILPALMALFVAFVRIQVPAPDSVSVDYNSDTVYPLVTEEVSLTHAAGVFSGVNDRGMEDRFLSVVAFTPNTSLTTQVVIKVKEYLGPNATFELQGFRSENEVEIYLAQSRLNNSGSGNQTIVRAVVVFEGSNWQNVPPPSSTVMYKIRLVDVSELEITDELFPMFQQPGPSRSNLVNYQNAGFTGLQIAMDKALIWTLTQQEPTHKINTQGFPYPPHTASFNFDTIYFTLLPRFMVLGFIFLVPSVIRNVVPEKETGIKELMKMMGLPNWMHWLGWMLNSLMLLSVSITIVIIFLFVPLDHEKGALITHGDWSVWWVVFFMFVMATTAFYFLLSTFFQRPTLATTFGIVLYLFSYFGPIEPLERNYQFLSLGQKLAPSVLPSIALHWGIKVMCGFEGKSVGARWSNLFEGVSSVDEMCVGYVILMLIFDTALFMTLTLYFENVIPSEFGLRKPWYYFLMFPRCHREDPKVRDSIIDIHESDRIGFEPEPTNLRAGVVIQDLRKQFGRRKVAVNMTGTLKMYDGQITALLGHNGAGKTTALSMLTGLFAPTSGTATVNGFDIKENMNEVRMNLGLCPQHNMLFAKLTVEEHLIFFGRLKGLSNTQVKAELKKLLEKLQLTDKTRTLAEALSGGQKRKLCLGMALIGGAKVVILDEPTSGMDPEARRAIWDLLLAMRGERTIILTTHFMEEADVLGDRIAIMAEGQVKCCGTSVFLRQHYGAGYTLKLTILDPSIVSRILEMVQITFPSSTLKKGQSGNPTDVDITIPNDKMTNAMFPDFFGRLSESTERLGIITVGLSLATMDDIFVKVGEQNGIEKVQVQLKNDREMADGTPLKTASKTDAEIAFLHIGQRLTGVSLLLQQFNGIFRKRMISTFRKRKLCISQFLMPLGLLIITILLSNTLFNATRSAPPLTMDLNNYRNPVTLFRAPTSELAIAYTEAVGTSATPVSNVTIALLEAGRRDLGAYRERYIIAGDLDNSSIGVSALFSTIPFHASPLSVNIISNAILKSMVSARANKIQVTIHPLGSGLNTVLDAANPNPVFANSVPFLFGVLLPIGLALLAASFIVGPVEEKICKAKQLQLMTGVSPLVFWGASFLWDFCLMFLLICLMLICFPIFENYGVFTAYHGAGVVLLILMLFGFSAISFSYVCSTFVATVPGGFSLVAIVHVLTGIILSQVAFLMESLIAEGRTVVIVRTIGRFFPTFGASVAIMRFAAIATTNSRCNILSADIKNLICRPNVDVQPVQRQCCPNCADFTNPDGPNCFAVRPYLTWTRESLVQNSDPVPGVGQDLFYLLLLGVFYKVILLIIEYGLVKRLVALVFKSDPTIFTRNQTYDEDVLMEKQRVTALVSTGRMNEDALVVENLCKSYGSFAAVSGLSFGVHHGECFGLLGVNGAGKTTSFRMLTGDEFRSFGNAFSMGLSLERDRAQFLSRVGYCPQFDGIIGVLTGLEMVELFGRLRGIPVGRVCDESMKWLKKLGLQNSARVQCQKYSGGMKRRLCAAIALVGDSPVILLDEPTSGVDPIARRQFWKVIDSVRESGQAVVLTSHSMEECEALCSRLGIMVNGQFQCLGGVQHLKTKYAQGFRLLVTLPDGLPEDAVSLLLTAIGETFHPCLLRDKHQRLLEFQVLGRERGWAEMFEKMETVKTRFETLMEDYSITETTLEEVFLSFARTQYPERAVNVSCFKKFITCHCCS